MAKAKDKHLFARCGCRLSIFAPEMRTVAQGLTMLFWGCSASLLSTRPVFAA